MKIHVSLFEMAYTRKEVMRAIDDHVPQILENWCMVYLAQRYPKFQKGLQHWAGELTAQIAPGMNKLRACDLSECAKVKLVDTVLVRKAELDKVGIVEDMLRHKFWQEHAGETLRLVAAREWVANGLAEVRAVLLREIPIDKYEQSKIGEL